MSLGALLGVIVPLAGLAARQGPAPGETVATVGERAISVEEFERHMRRRGGQTPGAYSTLEQKQALLEEMIRTAALAAKARKDGVDRRPDVVEKIERLLAREVLRAEVEAKLEKLSVSAEELERHYRENLAKFQKPERAQAAMIFLKLPHGASAGRKAEVRKRAEQALAEARALDPKTVGFGAVAVKYSEDQATRYVRGEIGWLVRGRDDYRWDAKLTEAVFALKAPGEFGPVIETPGGFYLVRLLEREPAAPVPLERVRDRLQSHLLERKRAALLDEFHESVKKQFPIDVKIPVLEAIEPPAPGPAAGDRSPPPLPGR